MNLKFLFLTVLSALIFVGCSTENAEDFENTLESFKAEKENTNAKAVTRPFKGKADGEWFIVPESTECNGLLHYSIVGSGNATHMGRVEIAGRICTNLEDVYDLTVTYTAANGDKVTWEVVEPVFNDQGLFAGGVFVCVEGTGRFSDAEGRITVDEVLLPTDFDPTSGLPLRGTFSNNSVGTITY